MQRLAIFVTAILALPSWFGLTGLSAAEVDFAKQILPIFMEHCAGCHGEKKGLGKLRLHTPEAIQEKWAKDDHLIVKGDAEKSELYERLVLPADHKKLMPKKADPLPEEKISLIRQWINEGAAFEVVAVAKPPAEEKKETTEEHGEKHAEEHAETPVLLPEVAAADPAALEKLIASGAQVNPLFTGSSLLQVSYALRGEPATDAEVAALADVAEQVYSLNLSKAQVSAQGLAVLSGLKNLSSLHLENSSLTDSGLSHLSGLESLQYLNVYGTQITDAGLKHLEGLKQLRKLYVWKTKVSYDAAQAMEKNAKGLLVSLGFDHPVIMRKRLTKELERSKQQTKDLEADFERTKAAFEKAKQDQEAAKQRLSETQKKLDVLDGKVKPEEEKKPEEATDKEEKADKI